MFPVLLTAVFAPHILVHYLLQHPSQATWVVSSHYHLDGLQWVLGLTEKTEMSGDLLCLSFVSFCSVFNSLDWLLLHG